SHYGLQEQLYNSAPLIIWTPQERAKADRQVVVMLSDFSFTPPEQILKGLKSGMQTPNMKKDPSGEKSESSSLGKMSGSMGKFSQFGVAQRLDLKVTIPIEGGAYPILAQGEGTKLLCGVVLVTKEASVPQLSRTAAVSTAALDNTQEKRLRALNPLPDHPIDRVLQAALGGNMGTYVWTINEAAYPNRKSLDIRKGERVGIAFS